MSQQRQEMVGLCRSEVRPRLQLHQQSSVIHFGDFIGDGKTNIDSGNISRTSSLFFYPDLPS